jgi:transposase
MTRKEIHTLGQRHKRTVLLFASAAQAVGASLRYLPKYSPDLNPIELVFHPLKTFLRKAAQHTIEGLHRALVRTFGLSILLNEWPTSDIRAMNHYDRDAGGVSGPCEIEPRGDVDLRDETSI